MINDDDQSRYDGLSHEILLFGVKRCLARVNACRRRMRTGLRQALTERADRGGKERKHE
jgi:hypothetical protein